MVSKKDKNYKPPHPLVEVHWDDAASENGQWVSLNSIEAAPEKVVTVGFLVKESDKAYVVAGSVANEALEEEDVGNTMIIPKGMVTSFRYVRLETARKSRKKTHATPTAAAGAQEPAHDHERAGKARE